MWPFPLFPAYSFHYQPSLIRHTVDFNGTDSTISPESVKKSRSKFRFSLLHTVPNTVIFCLGMDRDFGLQAAAIGQNDVVLTD